MEYKTHNETAVTSVGTSYRGEIKTDYDTLVELFGEPLLGCLLYTSDAADE